MLVLPSRAYVDWLFEAARWLIDDGIPVRVEEGARIIMPTDADFPVDRTLTGHALAEDYFTFVRHHAHIVNAELELVPDDSIPPPVVLAFVPEHLQALRSMRGPEPCAPLPPGERFPVLYVPMLLDRPEHLVAVLALGVGDFRVQSLRAPVPGGEEMALAAVDVMTIFLGFGIFIANVDTAGTTRLGALSQLETAYALALWIELLGANLDEVTPHLVNNARAWVVDAVADLRRHHAETIGEVRVRRFSPLGPYRV